MNYQTVDETPSSAAQISTAAKENCIVELACDAEINGATLRLQSGTTVRGVGKKRPQIVTPPNGLVIAVDQVRFENVDFIWRQRAEEITSPERHALVDVRAPHAEFSGCTFQALATGTFELPVAIRLSDNRAQRGSALAPAVRVRLEHVALQGVAGAIDCHTTGPAAIDLLDVLHLGARTTHSLFAKPAGRCTDRHHDGARHRAGHAGGASIRRRPSRRSPRRDQRYGHGLRSCAG